MAENQRLGTVSNFPLPRPATVQGPAGTTVQVPDHDSLKGVLWLMQDAITRLENPPASQVAATNVVANMQLTAAQSGSLFSNAGLSYAVAFTLPPAKVQNPPLTYSFFVSAAQVLKILASGGAKIQNGATTSAANGYTSDSTSGEAVTLVCLSTNMWVAHPVTGSHWTTV